MKQPRTEDQENLAAYVWLLARHRAALAQQLSEIEEYFRQAIRVASQYGVKQNDLATLTDRSTGRISQIIGEAQPVTDNHLGAARETWRAALDEAGKHLERLSKKFTSPEATTTWNANYNLVHRHD